jgi:hypothetical protein
MAWSDVARKLRRPALPECELAGRHANCANCLRFAAAAAPLPRTGRPAVQAA